MTDISSSCQLQLIPPEEWHILRDLYKRNWPENILTYYTIQNYIEWSVKNPLMDDIHIYSVDDKWREHGTYIMKDHNGLRYNVLFNTLTAANQPLMLAALRCVEREPAYTLTAYVERVKPAALKLLRELRIKDMDDEYYCPTLLYYLPKEQGLQLELKPLSGFVVKPLTPDLTQHIDNVWPHRYPGSNLLIRQVITNNMTFGIFEPQTNELCAWVMHLEFGCIGFLQVFDQYKRRGFGEHLVRFICIKLAERGIDLTATVMDTNVPSSNLFKKLGFRVIDRTYWRDKPALNFSSDLPKNSELIGLKHG